MWVLFWPAVRKSLLLNRHIRSGISLGLGGSKSGGSPFQYLTTIFTSNAPPRPPPPPSPPLSLLCTIAWMHTPSQTDMHTHTWSWQSSCHYWSVVRWGHGKMTAVTESLLHPHSRELKTNKPAAIGRESEIMCVGVCPLCFCGRVTVWIGGMPLFSHGRG